MAAPTRASSFLPTIKCSNCSVEIPISSIGDHNCAPAPPLPDLRLKALDGPFAPSTSKPNMPPPRPKSITPPPSLDATPTFGSILSTNESLPSPKTATTPRSASPAFSNNGRKSPFQKSIKSGTTPLIRGQTSPDITLSQDSAFPPFPTAKSRSATTYTPTEKTFNLPPNKSKPLENTERDFGHTSQSPRSIRGGSLLQRMDSIAPGPFNLRPNGQSRQSGHKKTSSMSSSQDFIRPLSSGGYKAQVQRSSTSSSNYTRNHSYSVSNTSASSRYTFDQNAEDVPTLPAIPPPPQRPSRPDDSSHGVGNGTNLIDPNLDFGSFGQERRSNTFPKEEDSNTRSEDKAAFHRRPSEPGDKSHRPRPSLAAAAMQPLHEIGSTSSFKPSKSIRSRAMSQVGDRIAAAPSRSHSRHDAGDDGRLQDAPPVPVPVPVPASVQHFGEEITYHTPHESTSSNESCSSGVKTGSSRSSPPLNDSPQRSRGQSDNSRVNNLFNGFQFDVDNKPAFEEPSVIREEPRNDSLKPRPNAPVSFRSISRSPTPREESTDGIGTPAISPDECIGPAFAPQSNKPHLSPAHQGQPQHREPSPRRPTTGNKGNCRGCGEPIRGKSISSADGRLTGRYHKRCFVCKTCSAPFQTADFYVWHNNPYCARHYHELNHSLCTKCDRGIEGQYLEIELRLKFHAHCFSCQECHRILRDDYFEWNGRTLCEQHAFRAAQQPSSLGPGRRYPERRTTRLMMM